MLANAVVVPKTRDMCSVLYMRPRLTRRDVVDGVAIAVEHAKAWAGRVVLEGVPEEMDGLEELATDSGPVFLSILNRWDSIAEVATRHGPT